MTGHASDPRGIRTVGQARRGGYTQLPQFYTLNVGHLVELVEEVERRRLEVCFLPASPAGSHPLWQRHADILCSAFIIVAQPVENGGYVYCLWRRDLRPLN